MSSEMDDCCRLRSPPLREVEVEVVLRDSIVKFDVAKLLSFFAKHVLVDDLVFCNISNFFLQGTGREIQTAKL
jgi:hypothetical protein